MSDYDDDAYMSGGGDDEEEFEFSFEEDEDDENMMESGSEDNGGKVDFENIYYSSKALKDDDLQQALASYNKILDAEDAPALFVFKSLKQTMKIQYGMGHYAEVLSLLDRLVKRLDTVPAVYAEESIKRILARYDKPLSHNMEQLSFLEGLYGRILQVGLNSTLATTTKLKSAGVMVDMGKLDEAQHILLELERTCDPNSKNYLEIIAAEIKLLVENGSRDFVRLRQLHGKFSATSVEVLHPRIQGVIKECGGLLALKSSEYSQANENFYDSFKCYDEAGDRRRMSVLPKLLVSSILSDSEINPFEAVEFQSFLKQGHIATLLPLYDAVSRVNMPKFKELLDSPPITAVVAEDDFCKEYLPLVRDNMNRRYIIKVFKVYSRYHLDKLSLELDLPLVQLIQQLLRMFQRGELPHIKLDLCDKTAVRVEESSIVPGNVQTKDVVARLKALYDNESERRLGRDELMRAQAEPLLGSIHLNKSDDLDNAIREWLGVIATAVPTTKKTKLSQIEQVQLEKHMLQQRTSAVESTVIDDSVPEVLQHTTMNSLNAIPQDADKASMVEENAKLLQSLSKLTIQLHDHMRALNQEIARST